MIGKVLTIALAVAIAIFNIFSQFYYSRVSLGDSFGFNELRGASRAKLLNKLDAAVKKNCSCFYDVDTYNIVLAKLESFYTMGSSAFFPTTDFFGYGLASFANVPFFVNPRDLRRVTELTDDKNRYRRVVNAHFGSEQDTFSLDERRGLFARLSPQQLVIRTLPQQTVLNRVEGTEFGDQAVDVLPVASLKDHLSFVVSDLGRGYYFGNRTSVALFQVERDFFYPDQTMAGFGRYLLFEVTNPGVKPRLLLWMTNTVKDDAQNRLGNASVLGKDTAPLHLLGRGSARVVSDPVRPLSIDGRSFVLLDMGIEPTGFVRQRTGLDRIYGQDVPVDSRKLVGFVRNISLIEDSAYQKLKAPAELAAFPGVLSHANVIYSGIYEDGWVADAFTVRLWRPTRDASLSMRAMIPLIGNTELKQRVEVLVNGRTVVSKVFGLGAFDLLIPTVGAPGSAEVQVRFSQLQHLPGPNPRPVAARLNYIGFRNDRS